MTRSLRTVQPTTSLAEALSLTREHAIQHLPVVEGQALVGVVSDRDLRLAMPAPGTVSQEEQRHILQTRTVGELMSTEVVTIAPDTPIEDAAKLFYEHHIGSLPVMEDGALVGILTATDMLRAFVELFGAHQPSCRLEVRMPNRPGELARVVRLIGIDHKINISGMVVPPIDGVEAVAVMHLQTRDPAELIEALEKMGYRVGTPQYS